MGPIRPGVLVVGPVSTDRVTWPAGAVAVRCHCGIMWLAAGSGGDAPLGRTPSSWGPVAGSSGIEPSAGVGVTVSIGACIGIVCMGMPPCDIPSVAIAAGPPGIPL
jgi:hypothetical protein